MHSHGVIAETDEEARRVAYKYYIPAFNQLGVERGWAPMIKEHLDYEIEEGAYYVGSPETVARKMARNRTIELYGTQVIPRVKELLKEGN